MASVFGKNISISIFGQSHGRAIGATINGIPAGVPFDESYLRAQLTRRAPSSAPYSTKRAEDDEFEILSGILNGYTTGSPICAVAYNKDTRSSDYDSLANTPRPSHADYAAKVAYNGFSDMRGGGHFSGRLTAPLVFAGSVCRMLLSAAGIKIASHVYSISDIYDAPIDVLNPDPDLISSLEMTTFPVISKDAKQAMYDACKLAADDNDSVGGIVECIAIGLPAGLGDPMFYGIENVISQALFAIPAIKGIEFGAGFSITKMRASKANDPFTVKDGQILSTSNNSGGIQGGISNGMPMIFRVAVKPTPSISKPQDTVDLSTMTDTKISIKGRHDPCIVPRVAPVVEAACAIALCDLYISRYGNAPFKHTSGG